MTQWFLAMGHCWRRIQYALKVDDTPDKDLRIQIQHAARRAGLID
ncbi:MAG: hypothetical protein AAF921_29005 [Cyanobacteria bacterium P01_D01_bin.44]